jgi:hypothetical protein
VLLHGGSRILTVSIRAGFSGDLQKLVRCQNGGWLQIVSSLMTSFCALLFSSWDAETRIAGTERPFFFAPLFSLTSCFRV